MKKIDELINEVALNNETKIVVSNAKSEDFIKISEATVKKNALNIDKKIVEIFEVDFLENHLISFDEIEDILENDEIKKEISIKNIKIIDFLKKLLHNYVFLVDFKNKKIYALIEVEANKYLIFLESKLNKFSLIAFFLKLLFNNKKIKSYEKK